MLMSLFPLILFFVFGIFLITEASVAKIPKQKSDSYMLIGALCVVAGLYLSVAYIFGMRMF